MGNSRVTVRLNDLNDCRALVRGSETKFLRFVLLTNVPRMILTWPHGMHATSHFTFANVSKTPYIVIVIRTVDEGLQQNNDCLSQCYFCSQEHFHETEVL